MKRIALPIFLAVSGSLFSAEEVVCHDNPREKKSFFWQKCSDNSTRKITPLDFIRFQGLIEGFRPEKIELKFKSLDGAPRGPRGFEEDFFKLGFEAGNHFYELVTEKREERTPQQISYFLKKLFVNPLEYSAVSLLLKQQPEDFAAKAAYFKEYDLLLAAAFLAEMGSYYNWQPVTFEQILTFIMQEKMPALPLQVEAEGFDAEDKVFNIGFCNDELGDSGVCTIV